MKTKLKASLSQRGFGLIEFEDANHIKCSIQDSSWAEQVAIWIGVEKDRMHLTKQMVKQLLPILQEFASEGDWIFRTKSFKRIKKRKTINL